MYKAWINSLQLENTKPIINLMGEISSGVILNKLIKGLNPNSSIKLERLNMNMDVEE